MDRRILQIRVAHPSIQSIVYEGTMEQVNHVETVSQLIAFLTNNVHRMYRGFSPSSIFNFTVSEAERTTSRTNLIVLE